MSLKRKAVAHSHLGIQTENLSRTKMPSTLALDTTNEQYMILEGLSYATVSGCTCAPQNGVLYLRGHGER